ncbi:putative DNA polymerase phi [Lyophyllum shimeji]|uniref:DNA polymerase phi n=1 Tax=Lyophyllum shimeji TaxID=47721 RepID=A0A9P3PG68_LYOSH|nr:putative DNA polymerase phi [Lyophyllum shimeji]
MSTTLPLFWHLSSASKKERLDASVKLIGALEQFQAQFVPKIINGASSGSDEEDEEDDEESPPKSDGLDLLNAQDVSYSLRRLVRGLASPRESSRLGFAVALTELLSRLDTVTCSQIVTLVMDGTKTQGSMSGQEERDMLFARLFGLTAVIQSGLLVRTGSLATSASSAPEASTLASYEETIRTLLALGEKKSWLRESAWWTISLAVDALEEAEVTWKQDAVQSTLQRLFVDNQNWSPEKVALALKLQTLYPNHDWREVFSPSFKNPDLLHASNLQHVARILKESAVEEDDTRGPKTSTGNWKPKLHFAWDVILEQLLPGPNSTQPPRGSFQDFFKIAVDESLFSSTASTERKYWGFQVFQKALPRVTQDSMPMLFTKNFMRTWINHLSHQDRYLHKIARQAATDIQALVKSNPQLGFALILQLTGVNGSQQFDRLTKTKTVENILNSMDAEGIKNYISYLFGQTNVPAGQPAEDIHAINTRRSWIIEQLGSLIRSGAVPKSDEWVQSVLDWLVIHGLFVVKKKSEKSPFLALHSVPHPAFSDELRHSCRIRLLSCLGDLNAQTAVVKSGDKSSKVSAVASDGEFWVSKVLRTILVLEQDSEHVALQNPLDDDVLALRNKAQEIAAHLRTVTEEHQEPAKGAELLLLAAVVQQYCTEEDDEVDTEALEASIDGATRMFPQGKKSKKAAKAAASDADAAPEPVDVFVDTIIGFLEKSTAYMRTVGNQVFALLSQAVQESTIDLITTQLERRGPSELLEDEDEDMEDVDEDGDEASESSEEESEESDAGSEDDDDTNDEEEDVELRNKIEEALRVNGIEAATGDSDEEEELMDDDQMMAVDEQLAAVFKSQAGEKKTGKGVNAQREATHFKNRVLDLVDTFVKKQPSSRLVIRLIPALIDLVVSSGQDERQLADKAKGILRSRIGKSKEIPVDVDAEATVTVVTDLHTRARKIHSSDMLATLSQCSLYLSRILLHVDGEKPLIQLYQQSLADFMTRKNSALNTNFFLDFIRRFPSAAWSLRNELLGLSGRAVNAYRQCQAYQLLDILIGQLPAMGNAKSAEVTGFMALLRKSLLEAAAGACDEKVTLSASQLKELLKLGLVAARQTQRVDPASLAASWQPDSWHTLAGRLGASNRYRGSPGLQQMCEQIARLTRGAETTKTSAKSVTKRKVDDLAEGAEAVAATKKAKRKKVKTVPDES